MGLLHSQLGDAAHLAVPDRQEEGQGLHNSVIRK